MYGNVFCFRLMATPVARKLQTFQLLSSVLMNELFYDFLCRYVCACFILILSLIYCATLLLMLILSKSHSAILIARTFARVGMKILRTLFMPLNA